MLEFMRQGRFGSLRENQLSLIEEIIQSKCQTGQLVENIFWVYAERDYQRYNQLELLDLNRLICKNVIPKFSRDAKVKQIFLQVDLAHAVALPVNRTGISSFPRNICRWNR